MWCEGAASRTDESINNLHVKLVRCVGLQARRPGTQPSPYAIYKFFDFPDHDTVCTVLYCACLNTRTCTVLCTSLLVSSLLYSIVLYSQLYAPTIDERNKTAL